MKIFAVLSLFSALVLSGTSAFAGSTWSMRCDLSRSEYVRISVDEKKQELLLQKFQAFNRRSVLDVTTGDFTIKTDPLSGTVESVSMNFHRSGLLEIDMDEASVVGSENGTGYFINGSLTSTMLEIREKNKRVLCKVSD